MKAADSRGAVDRQSTFCYFGRMFLKCTLSPRFEDMCTVQICND